MKTCKNISETCHKTFIPSRVNEAGEENELCVPCLRFANILQFYEYKKGNKKVHF